MCFEFKQDFADEHTQDFVTMMDLFGVANELGADTDSLFGLSEDMDQDLCKSYIKILEELIAAEHKAKQQALGSMSRCVNGYKWNREGTGYRCEGGMHFVTESELAEYMKKHG